MGWPSAALLDGLTCINGFAEGSGTLQLLASNQHTVLVSKGNFARGRPVGEHFGKVLTFITESMLSPKSEPKILFTQWNFDDLGKPAGEQVYTGAVDWVEECHEGHCKGRLANLDPDTKTRIKLRSPNINGAFFPTVNQNITIARTNQTTPTTKSGTAATQNNTNHSQIESKTLDRIHQSHQAHNSLTREKPQLTTTPSQENITTHTPSTTALKNVEAQHALIESQYLEKERQIDQKCYAQNKICTNKCVGKGMQEFLTGIMQKKQTEASASITMCGFRCDDELKSCLRQAEHEKLAIRREKEILKIQATLNHQNSTQKKVEGETKKQEQDPAMQLPTQPSDIKKIKKNSSEGAQQYCELTYLDIFDITFRNFSSENRQRAINLYGNSLTKERVGIYAQKVKDIGPAAVSELEMQVDKFLAGMKNSLQSAGDVSGSGFEATEKKIRSQLLPDVYQPSGGMLNSAAFNYWNLALGKNTIVAVLKCLGLPKYDFTLPVNQTTITPTPRQDEQMKEQLPPKPENKVKSSPKNRSIPPVNSSPWRPGVQ